MRTSLACTLGGNANLALQLPTTPFPTPPPSPPHAALPADPFLHVAKEELCKLQIHFGPHVSVCVCACVSVCGM